MISNNPDRDWEMYGKKDPYFGVFSNVRFRSKNLDEASRKIFFESGEIHLAEIIRTIKNIWKEEPSWESGLDYGCGVGRITMPMAKRWKHVVGLDVSPSMLAVARKNLESAGLGHTGLLISVDGLPDLQREYDFIHSMIVFQHIQPVRGISILARLASALKPGGFGALHFTYRSGGGIGRKVMTFLRTRIQIVNWGLNIVKGRPLFEPIMQMNAYDLGAIFFILQENGVPEIHAQLTNHGGHLGALLLFRKGPIASNP